MVKNLIYTSAISVLLIFFCCVESYAQGGNPAEATNMLLDAVQAYNKEDYESANKLLDNIVLAHPDNDAAWYYKALCAAQSDYMDEAEFCLESAIEIDPGNFWYRYKLAILYNATSRTELAVSIFEKLLKDFPKKSDLYMTLVEMYAEMKNYQKALSTLDEVDAVFGVSETSVAYRYDFLRKTGEQEKALEVLKEYNSRYSSPYLMSILADHYLSNYEREEALACYNEVLDMVPDYYGALLGKAETLRMMRETDEYFTVLESLVCLQSAPASSKVQYLSALLKSGDPKYTTSLRESMDNIVEKLVTAHPKDTTTLYFAGAYYTLSDREDKGKDYFIRNKEMNPDSYSATILYLELLIDNGDWDRLETEARGAWERFPGRMELLVDILAASYVYQERYAEAVQVYDEALEYLSDDNLALNVWAMKGDAYMQMGDSRKSYKSYEEALKIDPVNNYVLNNYAYYLSLDGKKLKYAYEMSAITVESEPENATYLDTCGWILYVMKDYEGALKLFKKAMFYGGMDSAVILDHYAEVLFALGEFDKASVYWNYAQRKNNGEIEDLQERIKLRKQQMKEKKK